MARLALGCCILVWHNCGRERLDFEGNVWRKTWCPFVWVHIEQLPKRWSIHRKLKAFYYGH